MALEQTPDPISVRDLIREHGYEWIGARLRAARLKAGMSIRDTAAAAQVSKNTLVRIERGEMIHNSSLEQILWGLKLTPRRLLTFGSQDSVLAVDLAEEARWYDMGSFKQFAGTLPIPADVAMGADGSEDFLPFFHLRKIRERGGFQPFFIRLTSATESKSHRGEEFIFVLSGEVLLRVGDATVKLKQHDGVLFHATEPHSYEPIGAEIPEIFCIIFASGKEHDPDN